MHPEDALLNLRARRVRSGRRPDGVARLDIRGEGERAEVLEELDEEEGHLVVRELLAEADARAGVEGEEDERVRGEVRVEAGVEEARGVELFGWWVEVEVES